MLDNCLILENSSWVSRLRGISLRLVPRREGRCCCSEGAGRNQQTQQKLKLTNNGGG